MQKKELRLSQIVETLNRLGRISVRELSEQLLTSEMTVRRYLDELESQGMLKRIHGGAVKQNAFTISEKNRYLIGNEITKNVEQKSAIGYMAASLIKENETVGFDLGTTVPFIAKYLKNDIRINALCVTFECATELYYKKNVNLILPGGHLHRDSDVFQSDEGIAFLGKVRTDKVFISAAGIHTDLGLTCYHDFHVTIKKLLMKSTKKIILVADSTKFGMTNPSYFADIINIDALITDANIPPEYRDFLESSGIELIIV